MQDRPTYDELLAAAERFLRDEVMPNIGGSRAFHARVAANALAIVRRELDHQDDQLEREWVGLDRLLGPAGRPPTLAALREATKTRNEELVARIRAGDADAGEFHDSIVAHVRQSVRDKLLVSNPAWLGDET